MKKIQIIFLILICLFLVGCFSSIQREYPSITIRPIPEIKEEKAVLNKDLFELAIPELYYEKLL